MSDTLERELLDAGQAIGLLGADGSLDASWFGDPVTRLEKILSNSTQRAGVLDLLDQIAPPADIPGLAAGEKWHPLLPNKPNGNLYLTVNSTNGTVVVGMAGELTGASSNAASLRAELPMASFSGSGVTEVAGKKAGPLALVLRVPVNLAHSANSIGLAAIRAEIDLAPLDQQYNLTLVLEGLDLDGSGAHDVTLDPSNLGAEATNVVIGLIHQTLLTASGGTQEAQATVAHLMPLVGLGSDGIPVFPFASLLNGPAALEGWLNAIIGAGKMTAWLGHFAGLFGVAAVSGSGTSDDPWRVHLADINANSGLDVTLAAVSEKLLIGMQLTLAGASATPDASFQAAAWIVGVPLAGTGSAAVLPSASLVVRSPRSSGTLVSTAAFSADSVRAGVTWNGSALAPVLELVNVTLQGTKYPQIDLTNTGSVASALANQVKTQIEAAIGANAVAQHLLALAGIVPPAGDAAWPPIDLAQLVANPTQAIAAVHRAGFQPGHNWGVMLAEVAGLLNLSGSVTGTGTMDDPWRVALAPPAGPLTMDLAAWNAQTTAGGDPQLRIGLRLGATSGPWSAYWLAELLAFDLPATGSANVALLGGQHLAFELQPAPTTPPFAGMTMSADSIGIHMDWVPGSPLAMYGLISNIQVTQGAASTVVGSLRYPSSNTPPTDIPTLAAAFGITQAQLETLLRILLARAAYSWADMPGLAVCALLGMQNNLPGMQADWPTLTDSGAPSPFTDPMNALKSWLSRVALNVSSDGSPFLLPALDWLRALLGDTLPNDPSTAPMIGAPLEGHGAYDDPWHVPIADTDAAPVELLLWLEPSGPPPAWAAGLAATIGAAGSFETLMDAAAPLASFSPQMRDAFAESDPVLIAEGLDTLAGYFASSDGVVPLSSQIPTGFTWTAGTPLTCSHDKQPSNASAITQILGAINGWMPAQRAVLLVGPAFSDHTVWSALLSQAESAKANSTNPAATFNLRVPGLDPGSIDLSTVTVIADFYTADLQDNGTGDVTSLSAQIGRVAARIQALRGVAPVVVAHSTAGIAARYFAQQNPAALAGLITLGTPHAGSPLTPLLDAGGSEGLRFLQRALPTLPAGPTADAVAHLLQALDSYLPAPPSASQSTLPVAWPYPYGSFVITSALAQPDTGGVKALALGGSLPDPLLTVVRSAMAALATAAANPGGPAATALGIGLLGRLDMPQAGIGDVNVDLTLRVDAYHIALAGGTSAPERTLTISAKLTSPTGWLVGSATSYVELGAPLSGTRLRWAELGAQLTTGAGGFSVAPFVRLHQAAFQSPTVPLLQLTDTLAPSVLGALFNAISTPIPLPFSPAGTLLGALTALGVAVQPAANGPIGLSADAWAAIQVDPAGYLAPQLLAALGAPDGFLGLSATGPGGWAMAIGDGPLEIYIAHSSDWECGVRVASGQQLTFGQTASIAFDLGLHVPSLTYDASLSFSVAALTLTASSASGISISAPPWLDPLALPPTGSTVESALLKAVPRLLLSSAVTTFFEAAFGPVFRIFPIDKLIGAPGSTLAGSGSMGNGTGLDSGKINNLLQLIGTAIGAPTTPSGLNLPGGFNVAASGTDPVVIALSTTTAIGGVLNFALNANIDSLRHVAPGGSLSLALPLPGTWGTVTIQFQIGPAGLALTVTPAGSPPIQLLPTFSGLGALVEGLGSTLLTDALDALNNAAAASTLKSDLIALATALQLYNGTFSAEQANWKLLLGGGYLANAGNRSALLDAIKTVLTDVGLPGTLTHTSGTTTLSWTSPAPVPATFSFGWDASGPAFSAGVTNLKLANGPLSLTASAGVNGSLAIQAELGIGFNLEPAVGINVTPQLLASYNGTSFTAHFYPLGDATSGLDIRLLPLLNTPVVNAQPGAMDNFILKWIVPVAANLLKNKFQAELSQPAWPGSSLTIQKLLDGSGVLTGASLLQMGTGLLTTLANNVAITIGDFQVQFVKDATGLGVRVAGFIDIPTDAIDISLRLGEVMSSPPWFQNGGVTLYLFDPTLTKLIPKLSIKGLGIGFTGNNGPLINTSFLRTGRMGGYLFLDLDLQTMALANNSLGAGIEIDQFGIPLGQALSGGSGSSSNPVAAGLLQSDGGSGGDTQQVNPAVDLWASYIGGAFTIKIQNGTGAVWIGIHQKFGPIYIDQVGLEITNNSSDVALVVDGSVQVAGFTVQADELGIQMPLNALASPAKWSLDLRGLAVSYSGDGVSISGGLLKAPGAIVEYDGMLSVTIADKGFTAVGSYARPTFQGDTYTSLFIFVSLPIVLGGPPFFFVTGLGGGAGINRRLLVPADITQIPNFILVSAIDDDSFANNPMGALQQIATNIPAKRGSYWFAAGIRFDTFVLIHSVAVVYVALDGGFEIGILGVSRLALPTEDVAIVSVELALKARFSSSEGILSIQAQLTDNSYLFNQSCQLTGGFAFFTWFPQGQFVLTIGGYHPAFQKPPQFPDVPRLGFHWSVSDAICVKGEAYFALTNSCVMAGGRLEATAHLGPASAWFIAYADFLICWDPFHYDIAIGVSIGVALDFDICFFVCGHVHIEVSLGASLHIIGPPLHGEVTVQVLFFSVTIPFGPNPNPKPNYITDFNVFAGKYISAGDPHNAAVGLRVTGGLLPPDPPGAQPNPGTSGQPWQLAAEWAFASETRMPASSYTAFVGGSSGKLAQSAAIDLAAMDQLDVTSDHSVTIYIGDSNTQPTVLPANFVITPVIGLFPEATWHWTDPDTMHAAARTVPALSGLNIQGVAVGMGQSALIPISKMVDDILMFDRPLPFYSPMMTAAQQLQLGADAASMIAALASVSSPKMLAAAATVLTGSTFSSQRVAAGFSAQGLSPLAARSLKKLRSAPPLVTPLSTGWDMKAVGLPDPKAIYRVPPQTPVILATPRLRSVMQKPATPLADSPVSIHTSVAKVKAAAGALRTLPPVVPVVAGAKLQVLPGAKAPQATQAAAPPRTVPNPETGILQGAKHAANLAAAAKQMLGDGVVVPAGATHLWDIPAGAPFQVYLSGTAAYRVVALNRAGHALLDVEGVPSATPIVLPANAAMLAVSCLGNPAAAPVIVPTIPSPAAPTATTATMAAAPAPTPAPAPAAPAAPASVLGAAVKTLATEAAQIAPGVVSAVSGATLTAAGGSATAPPSSTVPPPPPPPATTTPAPPAAGFGAISLAYAPAGLYPAAGWQVGNQFEQVGPTSYLGRGASLRLGKSAPGVHKNQKVSQGMVRLSAPTLDQDGVETRLPSSATVVIILLDGQDPSAAIGGDLGIAVDGAVLSTPPITVTGGRRRALLYDVKSVATPALPYFTISAGSLSGWQISAIAGLHGTALEWANRMHGNPPERLVPDGALTADGQIRVRLAAAPPPATNVPANPLAPTPTPAPASGAQPTTQTPRSTS